MTESILIYWLIAQIIGVVGLPAARLLLGALPDGGYAAAKPLGLLLTGYLAWLAAMLGLASFGAPLLVFAALAVFSGGLLVLRRQGFAAPPLGIVASAAPVWRLPALRGILAAWLRANWRMVLIYEVLFAAALVFLALLRAQEYGSVGPNPWGTERPMDFAFFNAIRVSVVFPPHDPWMSGYSINYYYFGYLLMAAVSLLAGVQPATGYNLSLALIFALTSLGIAGIVNNLVMLARAGRMSDSAAAWPASLGRWVVVVLTIVAILVAGNQAGALQVLVGDERVVALDGPQLAAAVSQALGGAETITLPYPSRSGDFGEFSEFQRADRFTDFNWWWPSRAVWDARVTFDAESGVSETVRQYAITEFPFFSFWLGDMHPHVMALPFGLLALMLALQTVTRPAPPIFWRDWLLLALCGIVLGSLYMINSWDLPTYLLLFLAALGLKTAMARTGGVADAWRAYLLNAALLVAACALLIAPFLLTFTSLVGGLAPLVDVPLIGSLTRILGFVTWGRTGLHNFLMIFGVFLIPLVALTIALARERERLWLLAAGVAVVVGTLIGFPLAALFPLGVTAALVAWRRSAHPADAFAFGILALGSAICLGIELVYIRDVFESRLNTIFKFYYQTWLLWGVASGYAVWRLAELAASSQALRRGALLVAPALALALLGSGLTYPWLTAGKAFREGTFAGLEGRPPRERTPDGAAAIAWLRANAAGDAVILEAVGPAYDVGGVGYGGVASSTGLASVMGWEGHQQQWRGGDPVLRAEIAPRAADVATIYSTTDLAQARALLATYGVDYIYLGEAERITYPAEGLAKLTQLGEVAFQNNEVTIIRVAGG